MRARAVLRYQDFHRIFVGRHVVVELRLTQCNRYEYRYFDMRDLGAVLERTAGAGVSHQRIVFNLGEAHKNTDQRRG